MGCGNTKNENENLTTTNCITEDYQQYRIQNIEQKKPKLKS
jgi:hypothetical protein